MSLMEIDGGPAYGVSEGMPHKSTIYPSSALNTGETTMPGKQKEPFPEVAIGKEPDSYFAPNFAWGTVAAADATTNQISNANMQAARSTATAVNVIAPTAAWGAQRATSGTESIFTGSPPSFLFGPSTENNTVYDDSFALLSFMASTDENKQLCERERWNNLKRFPANWYVLYANYHFVGVAESKNKALKLLETMKPPAGSFHCERVDGSQDRDGPVLVTACAF